MNIRALVAEAIGTFVLLFVGLLGVAQYLLITNGQGDGQTALIILPFAFGLGLMAAIAIGGSASGGHYNPAVTLAALFDNRIDWKNAIGYVIAQLAGAMAGTLAVVLLVPEGFVTAAVNQPGPTGDTAFASELHAFSTEAILTAIFIAVILTVTRKAPDQAIIVIPLTLVAIHFVGIFTSGASVNPTRSLAPAVVTGTYGSLWVYLTAPFVGAIVGWGAYRFLYPPEDEMITEGYGAIDEDDDDDEDDDEDDDPRA
jgi:aquaporin Z